MNQMHTYEAVWACRCALSEAEVTDTANLDARLLVQAATGFDSTALITKRNHILSEEEGKRLHAFLEKRLQSVPMAYILGHREFYNLDFKVDPRVLIPRSDTETLVEAVLSRKIPIGNMLDICTGSGCIGITLSNALHCPVTLSDLSSDALAVAEENAQRLCKETYRVMQSDLFSQINEKFDLIVANPPYLTEKWIEETDKQVKNEPRMALQGFDEDGLSLIRRLIQESIFHLKGPGLLFLECDWRQIEAVKTLLLANGFNNVYSEKDLAGKERVVYGERPCTSR